MKTDSENTNFSLRQLRAVHAVWTEGSFARAADRLGVVPSALSETVRQIEELAGGPLFDRRSPDRSGASVSPARKADRADPRRPQRVVLRQRQWEPGQCSRSVRPPAGKSSPRPLA
ncbi:helix-turn-helix domain-containing protein [Mangrovicoccus ximenensis]|uniref:helix-turn-helix domain-containing protein n=1 Tax=Mangrovicoccus ximenensis TaxID=1911570 RepID=UPI001F379692|nr:LysR family transcriptional regulator [Mangrovicoccus ximenensis]